MNNIKVFGGECKSWKEWKKLDLQERSKNISSNAKKQQEIRK